VCVCVCLGNGGAGSLDAPNGRMAKVVTVLCVVAVVVFNVQLFCPVEAWLLPSAAATPTASIVIHSATSICTQ
jgi:hypothetical protein